MIAQILSSQPFHIHVGSDADTAPFLMNEVGENGVFLALLDVVRGPEVSEFVAGFLPGHALLNPLFAATIFLPSGAGAFEGASGVGHFLHALVADLGQPKFDGLSFGAGNTLHKAQQSFDIGDIGEVILPVGGG